MMWKKIPKNNIKSVLSGFWSLKKLKRSQIVTAGVPCVFGYLDKNVYLCENNNYVMTQNRISYIAIVALIFALMAGVSSCTSKEQQELDALVEYSNQQMPMIVDECTVCTALVQEDDYVVYEYQIEGGKEVMDGIASTEATRKELVVDQLSNADFLSFVQSIVATGRGLGYRYHDVHSTRVIEIMMPCAELEKALGEKANLHN